MLCHAGAKKASSLQRESASSLQRESTLGHVGDFYETWLRYVVHQHRKLSIDLRNVILVVAVLVATASYQAVLSPPGGVGQGDNIPSITNTTFPNSFDQKIEAAHR
ncbi:hypothetical protein F0562_013710 [Nyssa sinensis]|uniref:PGG domain-containing protein n=1 Tax=Nyssa sinensis TaxID=561372 RepID=A0A5J4ZLE3_9ASTE|nr:hypothetical protein F0562_013710 [Nyssa sinensis]